MWPASWEVDTVHDGIPSFLVSVDGSHFKINEPSTGPTAKDPKYYSHKFQQSALNYELALSIYEQKLVWINGPFPASRHDITIFREEGGLLSKIPEGCRVIADNGYNGEAKVVSTPNPHDHPLVRSLKSVARSRQEAFNGRMKRFKCLDMCFRHGEHKHAIVFEAVAVICQFELENGSPLFDV